MAIESTFKNMAITLFSVCVVASALLGGVYALTKEPIEAAQTAKINNAIGGVVPAFDNDPYAEKFTVGEGSKSAVIYPAKMGGEIVGYAVEASTSKGFSGKITIMVGFEISGDIKDIAVISHAETPGLGAKISETESPFVAQFEGKNPGTGDFKVAVKKSGGDVDAITASTITSNAFCDAVVNAYDAFLEASKNKEE